MFHFTQTDSTSSIKRSKLFSRYIYFAMKQRGSAVSNRPKLADLIIPLVALVGLYWFSASFFLAKRSLSQTSTCDEATILLRDVLGLTDSETNLLQNQTKGCWMDRRVDSLVILVVDALRFDFAQHMLPLSIGARLRSNHGTTSSQLLQFVADPPTVTMQRLKGLTTGGLPTFADISGNFGGGQIDEDSWVQQLKDTPHSKRGLQFPSRLGFVGDDTWYDLFPTQFEECYPFPSFNTRDLDTVDNGCLERLPHLLNHLRTTGESPDQLEVIVAHFLGVDHVGHTYGPHNKHMDAKLRQVDAALSTTLDIIDESKQCHVALIFGDHGMTEDGNHGGGTEEEVNAALFVHFSPACGDMSLDLTPQMGSKFIQEAFQSIHQIDLVPTVSILLGLPIPFANLGGIVPSLLGFEGVRETAAALALNAAQVWRYFTVYSTTANKLPNLPELEERLKDAITAYKEALSHPDAGDSNSFYKACGLFKIFLVEASELGHRVWTRFDSIGMISGGAVLFLALVVSLLSLFFRSTTIHLPRSQYLEVGMTATFIFFQSGMLTFSNSYIAAEQHIVMFMMSTLGIAIFIRMSNQNTAGRPRKSQPLRGMFCLLIPLLSRVGELLVSGHGLDPSIRLHLAHNSIVFLSSLSILGFLRIHMYRILGSQVSHGFVHAVSDCLTILFLGLSWVEKRSPDTTRNGYFWARLMIGILILSIPISIYEACNSVHENSRRGADSKSNIAATQLQASLAKSLAVVSKVLIAIMAVTGPSTAASMVLFSFQVWMLFTMTEGAGSAEVGPNLVNRFTVTCLKSDYVV